MRKKLILLVVVCTFLFVFCTLISSAEEAWSWANYGFSGTAIANPDPFDTSSYLIGGYVASVNHSHPLPPSYVYQSSIILDTEGVAIRFRFDWSNTEAGYKAVADLNSGIAIFPMDESLDVAIATADGVQRFSFPIPATYDKMSVNSYTVRDDGSSMIIEVCDKTIAILNYTDVRESGQINYIASITVLNGSGYVYGRCNDTLVRYDNTYVGYSSQNSRALILVKEHTLREESFANPLPDEKETTEGWMPETETLPESETLIQTDAVSSSDTDIEDQTETGSFSTSEIASTSTSGTGEENESEQTGEGCQSTFGLVGLTIIGMAAAWIFPKRTIKR